MRAPRTHTYVGNRLKFPSATLARPRPNTQTAYLYTLLWPKCMVLTVRPCSACLCPSWTSAPCRTSARASIHFFALSILFYHFGEQKSCGPLCSVVGMQTEKRLAGPKSQPKHAYLATTSDKWNREHTLPRVQLLSYPSVCLHASVHECEADWESVSVSGRRNRFGHAKFN